MDRSTAIAIGVGGATLLFLAGVLLWPHPPSQQGSSQPQTGPAVVYLSNSGIAPGKETLAVRTVPGNGSQPIAQIPSWSTVQLSPGGKRVAVLEDPPRALGMAMFPIAIYSLATDHLLWQTQGYRIAFSPKGGEAAVLQMATGGNHLQVRVLNGQGRTVALLAGPAMNGNAASAPPLLFTPSGKGLVYTDSLGNLALYDLTTHRTRILYAPTGTAAPGFALRLYAGTPLFLGPNRMLFGLVPSPAGDQLGQADLYVVDTRSGRRTPFGQAVWNGGVWQLAGGRLLMASYVHASACNEPGILTLSSTTGRTWRNLPLGRSLPQGMTAAQRAQVSDMSPFYTAHLAPAGTTALVQADIHFCPVTMAQAIPDALQLWRIPLSPSGMGKPQLVAKGTLPTGNPWSPRGNRFLVLSGNGNLSVQEAATGARSLLARGVTWAAWSPYVPPLPASAFPSLSGSSMGPL